MREWLITATITRQSATTSVVGFYCDGALVGTVSCDDHTIHDRADFAFRAFTKDPANWLTFDPELDQALHTYHRETNPEIDYRDMTYRFVSNGFANWDEPWRFTTDKSDIKIPKISLVA